MNLEKIFSNETAVSPIVATLVLVVVAIAGAAAVGTIMGSFSGEVSDEASVTDATSAASTELIIAGSHTLQPVSELIADAYMAEHEGIKVTVQGGHSGPGLKSTQLDLIDIGSASMNVDTVNDYPDLEQHTIGCTAIVVIASDDLGISNCSKSELQMLYDDVVDDISGTNFSGVRKVYQINREDPVEIHFAKYLFSEWYLDDAVDNVDGASNVAHLAVESENDVIEGVRDNTDALGFVNYGFAKDIKGVDVLEIDGYEATSENIRNEMMNPGAGHYVPRLTVPLNYLTNGAPSSLEQSYIDFARSPDSTEYFEKVGYLSIT